MVGGAAARTTAVVTGAADGIGRATLQALRVDGVDAIGSTLSRRGRSSLRRGRCPIDFSCRRLREITGMTPKIDVLVNCAASSGKARSAHST